jgi:hypothetical protein
MKHVKKYESFESELETAQSSYIKLKKDISISRSKTYQKYINKYILYKKYDYGNIEQYKKYDSERLEKLYLGKLEDVDKDKLYINQSSLYCTIYKYNGKSENFDLIDIDIVEVFDNETDAVTEYNYLSDLKKYNL